MATRKVFLEKNAELKCAQVNVRTILTIMTKGGGHIQTDKIVVNV